ncbi:hypothetical protein Bbelb_384530 [Branchiostoma belcheri]|nr:hypothetical protein Bbelb_384530 [Branchiostoma belcheri]
MATYLTMFSSGVSVNPLSGAQTIKSKIPIGNRPMIDFPTVSLVQCLLFFWRAVGGPGGKFVSGRRQKLQLVKQTAEHRTPGRIDGRPGPGISNSRVGKCFKTRRIFPQRGSYVGTVFLIEILSQKQHPRSLRTVCPLQYFRHLCFADRANYGINRLGYFLQPSQVVPATSVNKRESREIIAAVNFSLVPYQNSFRLGGLSFPS